MSAYEVGRGIWHKLPLFGGHPVMFPWRIVDVSVFGVGGGAGWEWLSVDDSERL